MKEISILKGEKGYISMENFDDELQIIDTRDMCSF